MPGWISAVWNERSWLFDGIGAVLIGGVVTVVTFLYRRLRSKAQAAPLEPLAPPALQLSTESAQLIVALPQQSVAALPADPPVPGRLPSVPDVEAKVLKGRFAEAREYPCEPLRPENILGDIDAAPPLQREAKGDSYRGITVRWSGLLFSIRRHHRNPDILLVMMYASRREYYEGAGSFCFDVPDGPGWALIREGTFLSVTGVIEDASRSSIFLRDVVITEVR
jgi:hypothetical protein